MTDDARPDAPADADAANAAAPRLPVAPDEVDRSWTASYPAGVPVSYDYPGVPLTRLLDDAATDFPEVEAIEFLGHRLIYRQLLDQVDRLAAALHDLGVRAGARVGVVLPNCPQHVIAVFAVLRLGAIVVEHDPASTEAELGDQLNDAACTVVVCLDAVYPKLASLKGRLRAVEHLIGTGLQDYLPFPRNVLFPLTSRRGGGYYRIPDGEGVLRFTDLIRRTAPAVPEAPLDPARDVAVLTYTRGVTGAARGVLLTHRNLVVNAFQARLWLPDIQAGRERILCATPFSRVFGMTSCLTLGVLSAATLLLAPRFDAGLVSKLIDRRKPTLFPGAPDLYAALAEVKSLRRHDLSSIRACLSHGAPLPAEVVARFEELTGGRLRECYGLTEASPLTHANPVYGKAKTDRIGLPLPDTVCLLVDPADPTRRAAPGSPGELAVAGPQIMAGYWNRPDETAAVLRDGWLLTGDIAQVDDEGYFAIIDRKDVSGRPRADETESA